MLRICACCSKPFDATDTSQRWCKPCMETYHDHPPVNAEQKICPICEKPFTPVNKRMIYCSEKCKTREHARRYMEKRKKECEKAKNTGTRKSKKEKLPTIHTEWWRTYKKSSRLVQDAMLARRFGFRSYGDLQAAIYTGKADRTRLELTAMQQEREKAQKRKERENV